MQKKKEYNQTHSDLVIKSSVQFSNISGFNV